MDHDLRRERRAEGQAILSNLFPLLGIPTLLARAAAEYTPSAGERAVAAALAMWRLEVKEPPDGDPEVIARMIEACGWSVSVISPMKRAARARRGQRAPHRYKKNGDFAWCGIAFAYWWLGEGLRPRVRDGIEKDFAASYAKDPIKVLSSCYRIYHHWAKGTERLIAPEDVRAGDLVIVGAAPGYMRTSESRPAPASGSHVTMATGPMVEGEIPTVEGNAEGYGPRGDRYEGIVCRARALAASSPKTYRVLHCIRPLEEDFAS